MSVAETSASKDIVDANVNLTMADEISGVEEIREAANA